MYSETRWSVRDCSSSSMWCILQSSFQFAVIEPPINAGNGTVDIYRRQLPRRTLALNFLENSRVRIFGGVEISSGGSCRGRHFVCPRIWGRRLLLTSTLYLRLGLLRGSLWARTTSGAWIAPNSDKCPVISEHKKFSGV